MRKYRMGGNKIIIYILSGFTLTSFIMMATLFGKLGILEDMGNFIIFPIIFFLLWYGMLSYLIISNIIGLKRINTAFSGHKGIGIIRNNFISSTRSGSFCNLEIEHKTDSGEKVLMITSIETRYAKDFPIGNEIPLYINGDYAYFKKEEICVETNTTDNNYNNTDKTISFCPYCGYKLTNDKRCPNCNSNIE